MNTQVSKKEKVLAKINLRVHSNTYIVTNNKGIQPEIENQDVIASVCQVVSLCASFHNSVITFINSAKKGNNI